MNFDDYLDKVLKDPKNKEEYDALEIEFQIIQALIDARNNQHITQKELSRRTGITQADISRIENGSRNPSARMISRLLKALGMKIMIVPIDEEMA